MMVSIETLKRGFAAGLTVLALTGLSGCVTFPPPERGADDLVLSEGFEIYGPVRETPERWWESLGSPELNALVEMSLAGNLDLQQAVARIEQAIAIAQQNRAELLPQLAFSTEAESRITHQDSGFGGVSGPSTTQRLEALSALLNPATAGTLAGAESRVRAAETLLTDAPNNEQSINTESYSIGLTTSYEADLWGKLRSATRAAQLDAAASQDDLYAAMQTVVGQVVLTWLDLLQLRQTIRVTQEQLDTNRTTLELIELRFRKGLATVLDVYQQRQAVAQTEAVLPPLEAQYDVLHHELAVLLGKAPRTELALGADEFPEPGPLPDYGLPADLLAMRPDVRIAGLQLQAADWRVSAARADRLPALRLSAGFNFNGDEFDMIFDNWLTTLTASLTGPIFDGGRRRAEVDRTRAVALERLNAYQLAVLRAIAEVENALVQIDRQQAYIVALRRQYEAAENSHREALNRYQKGLNEYLPVLTALTNAQNLERSVIEAEHDLLVYRVQLHLALGGGWMADATPAARKDLKYE